jgi:hypothetical protein
MTYRYCTGTDYGQKQNLLTVGSGVITSKSCIRICKTNTGTGSLGSLTPLLKLIFKAKARH